MIITYHCDLQLPHGRFNHLANHVVGLAHGSPLLRRQPSSATIDYAAHSPFLARFIGRKLRLIPPPVSVAHCTETQVTQFRRRHNLDGVRVIGVVARLAAEKGLNFCYKRCPDTGNHTNARVLHAGPSRHVVGEAATTRSLPFVQSLSHALQVAGYAHRRRIGRILSQLDVLVLPSRNSTESFGLVQIEAMSCGVSVCGRLAWRAGTSIDDRDGHPVSARRQSKLADAVVAMLQANAPRPTLAGWWLKVFVRSR